MSTGNSIYNTLISPFNINSTSVTTTAAQINLLNNLSTFPPITQINMYAITATGSFTYTPTTGTKYAIFELMSGGGGSGGSVGAAGQTGIGVGGGGGSYIKLLVTTANLVSIHGSVGTGGVAGGVGNLTGGNGGNTTLQINSGTTWNASGGSGGGGGAASASAFITNTTIGGVPSNGTKGTLLVQIQGGYAVPGFASASGAAPYCGSQGGTSFFSVNNTTVGSSLNGNGYGGGASTVANVSGSSIGGYAGAQGVVIVTEFISA